MNHSNLNNVFDHYIFFISLSLLSSVVSFTVGYSLFVLCCRHHARPITLGRRRRNGWLTDRFYRDDMTEEELEMFIRPGHGTVTRVDEDGAPILVDYEDVEHGEFV